jgi:hypothetical protein
MKLLTWADVVLGFLLVVLPLGIGSSGVALLMTEQIPGVLLIVTAAWLLFVHRNSVRVTWLQELDGLWLIVGAFILLFSGRPREAVVVVLSGLLVLLLNMIGSWKLTRNPNLIA